MRAQFHRGLLHPKYWLTWLGFGAWYLLSLLPYRTQLFLGRGLGAIFYRLASHRREVARRNLELCFPEKSATEIDTVVRAVMVSAGIAFFEIGMAWFWPKKRLDKIYTVEGLDHLKQAEKDGVGVLLVAFHFTTTDIGGKLLGRNISVDGSYRPHNNPVYDLIQQQGRERHTFKAKAIPRGDVRAMVKALRAGRPLWYAPDQDYGAKHSIFVPFFGVEAATITATAQLARMGKARVVPFTQVRKADGSGYHLIFSPPLSDFPSGNETDDAIRVNQIAEGFIEANLEQYLWLHRRFKTRPPGQPSLYPKRIKSKPRKA